MIRKAAYAGSFYEASATILAMQFENWFIEAMLPAHIKKLHAVICPHAGYVYSGSCAAYSYKLLSQYDFKTAIIIHPSHRGNHFGFSVSPYTEYETPLGNLQLDEDLAKTIESKGSQSVDNWYHQNEHSMEVQLPFLKYIKPEIKVVPIMIGNQNKEISSILSDILTDIIKTRDDVIIIVSTDLSHYYSAKEAEEMDGKLIELVTSRDSEGFDQNILIGEIEACGFAGVLALLQVQDKLKDKKMIKLNYTHSGYTSDDFTQVVGYLSAALVSKE